MKVPRIAVVLTAAAVIAAGAALVSAPRALAYGKADQPLAQLTVSMNCFNPTLCSPVPGLKGGFGEWGWIEIDAGGTGDAAGAGCGHLQGQGGGAGGGPLSITWEYASAEDLAGSAITIVGTDPHDQYYVVNEFGMAFPTTFGHYSTRTAPGIQTQVQVAP